MSQSASNKPYLLGNLKGGLGNQLFELYTTISASIHLHMPFKFFNDDRLGDRGTYWNTIFRRLNPIFLVSRDDYMLSTSTAHPQIVREPHFHHQPFSKLIFGIDTTRNVVLDGYFQSSKYFEAETSIIERMLQLNTLRDQVCAKLPAVLGQPWNGDRAISVHFRLGDYKRLPNHHPTLTVQYYRSAREWMTTQFVQHKHHPKHNHKRRH